MKGVSTSVVRSAVIAVAIAYLCVSPSLQPLTAVPSALLKSSLTRLNKLVWSALLVVLEPRLERTYIQQPESFMTTPEIIEGRGYPVEIHHVVTEDGYILELHRIPHGRLDSKPAFNSSAGSVRQRRPVFLMHGMMGTDHFWMFSTNNNSLAFILADHGYDVWLGNARGNAYSRRHVSLNPEEDEEFWDYSWDEMGYYDVPASVDYVLNVTGQQKLAAYFGYSLGCSVFFMGAASHPRLNDQVEVMVGLGPTVSVAHLRNFFRYISPFVKSYQFLQSLVGGPVHLNDGLLHLLTRFLGESQYGIKFAEHLICQIFGYSDYFDVKHVMSTIAGHYPSGGGVNVMVHLFQNYNSGESFLHFDHGVEGNLKRYGTAEPPEYNLTLVTAPVYLVHSDNDVFAPPEDVAWLAERLGNLQSAIRVANPMFSHGDFVWSPRAAELVHRPVLDLLPSPFVHEDRSITV